MGLSLGVLAALKEADQQGAAETRGDTGCGKTWAALQAGGKPGAAALSRITTCPQRSLLS